MTIDGNHIKADKGKALRRIGESGVATATDVWLAPNDRVESWEEVDYGQSADEPTEADKDAALRRFGVEV